MRSFTLPIAALAAVLALVSCGGSSDKQPTATSAGPTGKQGTTQAGTTGPSGAGSNASAGRGGQIRVGTPGVKAGFVDKSFFGARSAIVYFVAKGPRTGWLDQARSCVRKALRRAPSAYCFGFPSDRAFSFSNGSRHPPAKMTRQCWAVYWGQPQGRRPISASSNPAAAGQHCPDSGA